MDVGEDDTIVFAGLSTGEAKPKIFSSVQFESRKPHKIRLFENADSWKPKSPDGISLETWLREMLNSYKFVNLKTPIELENWFDSSRKVQQMSLFVPFEEALNDINGVKSGWSLVGGVV
ncbi:hypothetical protein L1987_08030 [Smallanthus sonchifolius]|uniref:Uncharacterized protein n=1 Tax=Smallanthus sonchifolius TaxID=185202 RepID=A0ACB9JMJ0_9ASTR|nr:hypothetical protein L1987_08030 [Smallanthus sonchifolius]